MKRVTILCLCLLCLLLPLGTQAQIISGGGGGGAATGLNFGGTIQSTTSTAPSSGQCIEYNGTGLTGTACSGGTGSNPIFTHTLTESAGAATMAVNSGTVAATDIEYVAANGNGTWTFPAAMQDGEIIVFDEQLTGTSYSNTFAKGTLITTFASDVLGDSNTAPGSAAACGAVPATGDAWFRWQYTGSSHTMTLLGCSVDPPGTTLAATLGGTGVASPTAHDLMIAEGGSPVALVALATDNFLAGTTGADPAGVAIPNCGDSSHALAYSTTTHTFSCQSISGTTNSAAQYDVPYYSAAGTASTLSGAAISGIQKDSTSAAPVAAVAGTDYAAATTGSANTPLFNNGSGGFTNGTRSGNTTEVATASGTLTSGDCAKFDANGNVVDNGATCGGGGGTLNEWLTFTGAVTVLAANTLKCGEFDLPVSVTFAHEGVDVSTSDTTSGHYYDVCIYTQSGTLKANLPASTAFSSTGAQGFADAQTSQTITPGIYWACFTGNATVAGLTQTGPPDTFNQDTIAGTNSSGSCPTSPTVTLGTPSLAYTPSIRLY